MIRLKEEQLRVAQEEGEKPAYQASLRLYAAQKQNYDKLMEFITSYQPSPFSKAWGNDPEYIELCKKFSAKDSQTSSSNAESKDGESNSLNKKKKKSKKKKTS